jgi:integrase
MHRNSIAESIRWYRREILPRLGGDSNGDLFLTKKGTLKSQETLSQQMTETIAEKVGIHMTPHQFRHLAAVLYLEVHPEDFQTVSDLLGHAFAKTTTVYAGSSSRRASRAYGKLVIEQREAAAFRGRRISRRPR